MRGIKSGYREGSNARFCSPVVIVEACAHTAAPVEWIVEVRWVWDAGRIWMNIQTSRTAPAQEMDCKWIQRQGKRVQAVRDRGCFSKILLLIVIILKPVLNFLTILSASSTVVTVCALHGGWFSRILSSCPSETLQLLHQCLCPHPPGPPHRHSVLSICHPSYFPGPYGGTPFCLLHRKPLPVLQNGLEFLPFIRLGIAAPCLLVTLLPH